MKLLWIVVLMGLCALKAWSGAVSNSAPALVFTPGKSATLTTNFWQRLPLGTNGWRIVPPGPVQAPGLTNSKRPLTPGVYEAEPYTMIVVVPAPHPDDKCIAGGLPAPFMPRKEPELRLVPRKKP